MLVMIRFLSLVMAGLMAGAVFGIWLGYNPHSFSAPTFIEQHQGAVKGLNTSMPILGLITIILTLALAYLQRGTPAILWPLLIAVVFMIISALTTRLGNQPINSIVMTWSPNDYPANWEELRDKWWGFHQIRTATTFIAFAIIAWVASAKG